MCFSRSPDPACSAFPAAPVVVAITVVVVPLVVVEVVAPVVAVPVEDSVDEVDELVLVWHVLETTPFLTRPGGPQWQ